MIAICRETKRIYYFVLVPAFLITLVIGLFKPIKILVFLSVALYLVFYFILYKCALKTITQVNKSLALDLETDEYIDFYEKALKNNLSGSMSALIKTNLVKGYLAKGDFDKAFDLYEKIKCYYKTSPKPEIKIWCLDVSVSCCLYLGDFQSAEIYLNELERINSTLKKKEDFALLKLRYKLLTGNFENLESEYSEIAEKIEEPYSILNSKYIIGCYYEQIGLKEKALSEFTYVAENGKNLYVAKEARQTIIERF